MAAVHPKSSESRPNRALGAFLGNDSNGNLLGRVTKAENRAASLKKRNSTIRDSEPITADTQSFSAVDTVKPTSQRIKVKRVRKRDIAKNVAQESAIGCGTHFLLTVAGVIFLGGAAAYHGWVGKVFFILAALLVLIGAASFPQRSKR